MDKLLGAARSCDAVLIRCEESGHPLFQHVAGAFGGESTEGVSDRDGTDVHFVFLQRDESGPGESCCRDFWDCAVEKKVANFQQVSH